MDQIQIMLQKRLEQEFAELVVQDTPEYCGDLSVDLYLVYEEDINPDSQLPHIRRDICPPFLVALLNLLCVKIREDIVQEELPLVRQGCLWNVVAKAFREHPGRVRIPSQQVGPNVI
jgi:hypothetical protein